MAIYRSVQMTFWTDTKVLEDFTPEDKYFYLYLLTNPHTNLCGCYEINTKQISMETGYKEDTVKKLIKRLEEKHRVIAYDTDTKEMIIFNWHKFNWTSSEKFRKPLIAQIQKVKNIGFKDYLSDLCNGIDTVSIPYQYGISEADTNKVVTKIDKVNYQEIADLYNSICVSLPKIEVISETRKTAIRARLKKNSIEDITKVFEMAEKSDFLAGRSKEWSANFDWLMKESNFVKVLEGNYTNKQGVTTHGNITISAPNSRQRADYEEIDKLLWG